MDSIEICYREGRGEAILEFVPESPDANARAHGLQRALRVQEMRRRLSGTGAAAFFVQQSVRRMPALPGIRQHHRFRHRSVIPDKGKSLNEGAIEPWTKPRYRAARDGSEALRPRERHSPGRSLPRSHVRAAQRHPGRRQVRRLHRREGLLRLARTQEIQAARARLSEPLSRLRDLPGLPRHAAARRSARGAHRGQARSPKSAR